MTSLIPSPSVSLVNGRPSVSSLKIAEHFGKRHAHVIRDIQRISSECPVGFTEPNFGLSEYIDETGHTLPMYHVSQDGFMLLAMGYTGTKALQIKLAYISAFNAMEAELANGLGRNLPDFSDPVIAARAWADALEQKQLAEKRTLALEALLFAEAVDVAQTTILIGDFAKILRQNGVEMGQKCLFDWLRENGYLMKQHGAAWNSPTQRSMELGLFEIKETVFNKPDGTIKIAKTTKLTGKGQVYFINRFLAETAEGCWHERLGI